jgi:hypothetical protein
MANGTFVHFLDDDDIVMDGHYAEVKAAFAANPTIGLVFAQIEPFGSGLAAQLEHERQYFADAARKAALSGRFGPRFAFAAACCLTMHFWFAVRPSSGANALHG